MCAALQSLLTFLYSRDVPIEVFELFKISEGMTLRSIVFISVAGLRGSLALVMVQTIIKLQPHDPNDEVYRICVDFPHMHVCLPHMHVCLPHMHGMKRTPMLAQYDM